MWLVDKVGIAHFLVTEGEAARRVLEEAGMAVAQVREVLLQRLNQEEPGQLGKFCRAMADAGISIELLYSDHDHQLIVATDNHEAATAISEVWTTVQ